MNFTTQWEVVDESMSPINLYEGNHYQVCYFNAYKFSIHQTENKLGGNQMTIINKLSYNILIYFNNNN